MGAARKADWREDRRKRAWDLKEQGWQQKDIAVALQDRAVIEKRLVRQLERLGHHVTLQPLAQAR